MAAAATASRCLGHPPPYGPRITGQSFEAPGPEPVSRRGGSGDWRRLVEAPDENSRWAGDEDDARPRATAMRQGRVEEQERPQLHRAR